MTAVQLCGDFPKDIEQECRRKDQKKAGYAYLNSNFNIKLKLAAQWEKWYKELKGTLGQVNGVYGVPLLYIICKNEVPAFDPNVNYEEALEQTILYKELNMRKMLARCIN